MRTRILLGHGESVLVLYDLGSSDCHCVGMKVCEPVTIVVEA